MTGTANQPKERPRPCERENLFSMWEPSLVQMLAAGSPVECSLDAAIDENIKRFCEQIAKSNDLDSLAYRTDRLADGTDGISTLPSALPSGVNPLTDNDLRKADGTDGKLLARARERHKV